MKDRSITENQSGFSTLEILIALALAILTISAVTMVGFGSQSVAADSQSNTEALHKAQEILDDALATSRNSFDSVVTTVGIYTNGIIYNTLLDIPLGTSCLKAATSTVSWIGEHNRPQKVMLKTQLTNLPEMFALGGDCATDIPEGGWTNPTTYTQAEIDPSGNQGTDIDVDKIDGHKYAFLTSVHSNVASDDFWIFDVETTPPILIKSLDTGPGLNAVDVAKSSDGNYYAFVASKNSNKQFQVIRLDFTDLSNTEVIKEINTTDAPGTSIYFYDDKVYVGHDRNSGVGQKELHVFNVTDPAAPTLCTTREVNHNINKILVSGSKIYMATSSDGAELTVLNISGCTITPAFVLGTPDPGYDAPGNTDATSLTVVGNRAFLGRERDNNADDFFVLNITDAGSIAVISSKDFDQSLCDRKDGQGPKPCLGPNTEIIDMVVVGNYAFLATTYTTGGFQVWDVSNPANIKNLSTYNYSEKSSGIDYSDNLIYMANQSQDALRVIRPAECADKIDDDGDGKIDIADPQCHIDDNAQNPVSYDPEDEYED